MQLDKVFADAVANGKLVLFPLGRGYLPKEIENIEDQFVKLHAKARSSVSSLRVLLDFAGLVSHHSFEKAKDLLNLILSKKDDSLPKQDKKKQASQTVIAAFNLKSVDETEIKTLIGMHKNVVISSRDGTNTLALDFRARRGAVDAGVDFAPKEALERFVKRHLETIVLSMLRDQPMCGYDVIKTIYRRYHTSLSQGTVYSLLYSLEAKGLLGMMDMDSQRSKVYKLTEQGLKTAEMQIKDFIVAQRYLLESIQ